MRSTPQPTTQPRAEMSAIAHSRTLQLKQSTYELLLVENKPEDGIVMAPSAYDTTY